MRTKVDLAESVLLVWSTTHKSTVFLIKHIPPGLWNQKIPGYPRKTIGMLAHHLHGTRCWWIKSIVKGNLKTSLVQLEPGSTRKKTLIALKKSYQAMHDLLHDCIDNGGRLPSRPSWLNFPNDVLHLLAYFAAHEAHHRGQIIMAARQLDHPLPAEISAGVWQWNKRLKETDRNANKKRRTK